MAGHQDSHHCQSPFSLRWEILLSISGQLIARHSDQNRSSEEFWSSSCSLFSSGIPLQSSSIECLQSETGNGLYDSNLTKVIVKADSLSQVAFAVPCKNSLSSSHIIHLGCLKVKPFVFWLHSHWNQNKNLQVCKFLLLNRSSTFFSGDPHKTGCLKVFLWTTRRFLTECSQICQWGVRESIQVMWLAREFGPRQSPSSTQTVLIWGLAD